MSLKIKKANRGAGIVEYGSVGVWVYGCIEVLDNKLFPVPQYSITPLLHYSYFIVEAQYYLKMLPVSIYGYKNQHNFYL